MPTVVRLEKAPGSSLQLLSGSRGGDPIGTIAIPTRDNVSAQLFISLMNTDWSFLPPDKQVHWAVVQGSILTSQRNTLVQRMRGDWILFIDSDMVFDTRAIGRLIATRDEGDFDMLGGLCFQRAEPYQPTLYMRESPHAGGYAFLEKWDSDVVEVDGTGMAFMIIHKRVFERMARHFEDPDFVWPPYEQRVRMEPPNYFRWVDGVGEDLRFCQDAKASGSRILVDTRNEIGHVGEQVINHRTFLREVAYRSAEDEATRRRLNDPLGLPTMTQEEARGALLG